MEAVLVCDGVGWRCHWLVSTCYCGLLRKRSSEGSWTMAHRHKKTKNQEFVRSKYEADHEVASSTCSRANHAARALPTTTSIHVLKDQPPSVRCNGTHSRRCYLSFWHTTMTESLAWSTLTTDHGHPAFHSTIIVNHLIGWSSMTHHKPPNMDLPPDSPRGAAPTKRDTLVWCYGRRIPLEAGLSFRRLHGTTSPHPRLYAASSSLSVPA